MPKVTVYDMTGKSVGEMNLSDAQRFAAVAASPGDRRALVMQDRVPSALPSGHTAVSPWARSPVTTATRSTAR